MRKVSLRNVLTAAGAFLFAACLTGGAMTLQPAREAAAEDAGKTVTYSDFSTLPEGWQVYDKSDTYEGHTTTHNDDGTMSVKSTNITDGHTTSSDRYYDLTYLIGEDTWGDFTFTMTFKMTDAEDDTRWLGVVYHTNFDDDGYMAGYIMNYRYNGMSTSSAVTYGRAFLDDTKANGDPLYNGVPLSDGEYHTMKIVMEGTTAYHYMDGGLICTYDTTTKSASLGGDLTSGGFALIVNGSVVTIREVTITDQIEEEEEGGLVTDTTLVDTYEAETGLISPPAVAAWVHDADDLSALTAAAASADNERLANAILNYSANGQIVGDDGTALGDFADVYESLNHNVIPVLYISDQAAADALTAFLTDEIDILDMAVMSSEPALVKSVREAKTSIRGIILFEEAEDLYDDVVAVANSNYANVAVLPAELATQDNVEYIQKRFKTVWAMVEGSDDFGFYEAINSGAYGIVTDDFAQAYDVLATYPEGSTSRTSFVVGHRGTPQTHNQNSISGFLNAAEAGISHVEFDVYLTTDDEVVLMHNTTLAETTNVESVNGGVDANRNIETMSLAEIRQYRLDQYGDEEIPILEDVLAELVKTDIVFVLEIKSTNNEIVPLIKEKLDEYDCYDQVVIISFFPATLGEVKNVMPQVPTAYLGSPSVNSFANDLVRLGNYNTNVDMNYDGVTQELNAMLRDRGFIGWYWTYATTISVRQAASLGYVGLTTDSAEYYVNNARDKYLNPERLVGTETQLEAGATLAVGDTISLTLVMYNGTEQTVEGTVFALTETENGYEVIASYLYESVYSTSSRNCDDLLYTQAFAVTVAAEQPGDSSDSGTSGTSGGETTSGGEGSGCGSALGFAFTAAAALLVGGCFTLRGKRK